MALNTIQYEYALDEYGKKQHISKVEKTSSNVFTCLECGKQMIPKMGAVNQWHFAHKAIETCNAESYLHKLSKLKFYDNYSKALTEKIPFIFETDRHFRGIIGDYFRQIEDRDNIPSGQVAGYDLTLLFDKVGIEEDIQGFRADVLLSSTFCDAVLLIEIKVTHKCSTEKIKSGLPIYELLIETQEDIESRISQYSIVDKDSWQSYAVCHNIFIPEKRKKNKYGLLENNNTYEFPLVIDGKLTCFGCLYHEKINGLKYTLYCRLFNESAHDLKADNCKEYVNQKVFKELLKHD